MISVRSLAAPLSPLALATALALSAQSVAAQSGAAPLLAAIESDCAMIIYEEDCIAAVRRAAEGAADLDEGDRQQVADRIAELVETNPNLATQIRRITDQAGLTAAEG